LLPAVPALWRGPRTLQLGIDPSRAVVLEFSNPAVARLLPLLDGRRSESAIIAEAGRRGVSSLEARALLETLRAQGLVVGANTLLPDSLAEPVRRRLGAEAAALALRGTDAPGTPAQVLRRRSAARVKITGRGRLGVPIALALAAAGVGHLDPHLEGRVEPGELADAGAVHRQRRTVAAESITRAAPGTRVEPLRRADTTFVVQVGNTVPATLQAIAYRQHRLAHLAVCLRDGTAILGPLVPPRGTPCLNCLELHRKDRDPTWPSLAAQLAATVDTDPSEACAMATVLAATGYAAADTLRYIDGDTPHTLGVTVEITAPGVERRRTWSPHPGCDCTRRRRRDRQYRRDT
jgi:hypothetical protein